MIHICTLPSPPSKFLESLSHPVSCYFLSRENLYNEEFFLIMKILVLLFGYLSFKSCVSKKVPLLIDLNYTDSKTCSSILPDKFTIKKILKEQVPPYLNNRYGDICSSRNRWTKVVDINMSSANTACPSGWVLSTNEVRGCGRNGDKHTSPATFRVDNIRYTQVCGRVSAVQKGTTNVFAPYIVNGNGLNVAYVDGISLTYQSPGNKRKHIWTFASGFAIDTTGRNSHRLCPCIQGGPTQIPGFVGSHYFCEAGSQNTPDNKVYYVNNILWDGQGCVRERNKCCEFNRPPWFFVTLPQATSSNLEMRILFNESAKNENIIVTEVEMFVK